MAFADNNKLRHMCNHFLLKTKLEDDTVYRLVIAADELLEMMQEKAEIFDISTKDAIIDYVREYGAFGAYDIVWKE
ncbi:MAG: hypothetical protein Q4C59_13490 [Lachnospiraceae bacterium]|nr:hypothetical protein [Lachnospiraceae bacterium]